jgi:lysophospholipid acyltransferase (LPLAT)-like uncharacterized protein
MGPTAVESARNTAAGQDDARSFSWIERAKLFLITWAGYLFIRLVAPTLHYRVETEPGAMSNGRDLKIAIWCFWHRSVVPATWCFRHNQIAVMTSRSFDGEYIARIIHKFGYRAVRGSSSRGAVGALLGMRRELERGHPVAFTIDGPRGPLYVAKPGPVLLAKKTALPICCFYIAVERAWVLNSWDRMILPKPFSRAALHMSSPIHVPADANDEQMAELHRQMQQALERCRDKAEEALSPQ